MRIKRFKSKIGGSLDERLRNHIRRSLNASNNYFNPVFEERAKNIFLGFLKNWNNQMKLMNKFKFHVGRIFIAIIF